MKIGDKFVSEAFGTKVEYEVIGFDGSDRPVSKVLGIVTENIITEEKIAEVKAVVEKKPTVTKVPTKKTVAKKK